MTRTAVVLFNLGGPDSPEAVRPFLFNLFNDPAIIGVNRPLRWLLATLIASRRAPVAREIYANLGGASPLLANTQAQARALEVALEAALETEGAGQSEEDRARQHATHHESDSDASGQKTAETIKTFVCMRYWHPMSAETARQVAAWTPDTVVLLPLYPQFSTTTTGSSIADWQRAADRAGLQAETLSVCCYPVDDGFLQEVAARLGPVLETARRSGRVRVLFSAHGLPKKVVDAGDPYQWQVEQSVQGVVKALNETSNEPDLDWLVCYQSRVGPLEWIGPDTESEIRRAAGEGLAIVVVPIAFVSEHSETLVELDIEYRALAEKEGAAGYFRVPTVDTGGAFIEGLAQIVLAARRRRQPVCSGKGGRICPATWRRCAMAPRQDKEGTQR